MTKLFKDPLDNGSFYGFFWPDYESLMVPYIAPLIFPFIVPSIVPSIVPAIVTSIINRSIVPWIIALSMGVF